MGCGLRAYVWDYGYMDATMTGQDVPKMLLDKATRRARCRSASVRSPGLLRTAS